MSLVAPGVDIVTTAVDSSYKHVNGTSFSAPHVAATAALILSLHPSWTPDEVRSALELSADDRIDRSRKGWDIFYGAGRLNARRAVETLGPPSVTILSPEEDTGFRGDS